MSVTCACVGCERRRWSFLCVKLTVEPLRIQRVIGRDLGYESNGWVKIVVVLTAKGYYSELENDPSSLEMDWLSASSRFEPVSRSWKHRRQAYAVYVFTVNWRHNADQTVLTKHPTMLPPRRREDRLHLLVSVSLGGCAQKEHRDSLRLPYKCYMEACDHHVILCNHRQRLCT